MSETMRQWSTDSYGRGNLKIVEVPVPELQPGLVLVKTSAVSLNFRDKLMVEDGMGSPLSFPFVPCSDTFGIIVALGTGVTRFAIGDRVISTFFPGWIDGVTAGSAQHPSYRALGGFYQGVLSEYVALSEDWFCAAPNSLSDAEASTLPVAGLTDGLVCARRAGGGFVRDKPYWSKERAGSRCGACRSPRHMVRKSSSLPVATTS